ADALDVAGTDGPSRVARPRRGRRARDRAGRRQARRRLGDARPVRRDRGLRSAGRRDRARDHHEAPTPRRRGDRDAPRVHARRSGRDYPPALSWLGAAARRLLTRTASRRARPAAGPTALAFLLVSRGPFVVVPRPRVSVAATNVQPTNLLPENGASYPADLCAALLGDLVQPLANRVCGLADVVEPRQLREALEPEDALEERRRAVADR